MTLFLMTALVMVAFAANSILTRWGVDGGYIDPAGFALIRVLAGAAVLFLIVAARGRASVMFQWSRLPGAASLTLYLIGFSLAYLTLDAGLGALILFGVVQVTMFGWSAIQGDAPNRGQLIGAAVAFGGLLLALWPGPGGMADPVGAGLMVLAGIGWAAYSVIGRGARDPMAATASNFLLALPMVTVLLSRSISTVTVPGAGIAIVCGAVTSALGYALWYLVLPRLNGGTAAIVQLSVPLIAILAGSVLLAEPVPPVLLLAAVLVVGGIAWSIRAGKAG